MWCYIERLNPIFMVADETIDWNMYENVTIRYMYLNTAPEMEHMLIKSVII